MRMIKNAAAVLFLSRGIPMFLAGDEFGNTQFGNNNPYCQDNIISWLDWGLLKKNKGLFDFFKYMIAFRKQHAPVRMHTASCSYGFPELSAHDVIPWETNFAADAHYTGIMYAGRTDGEDDCVYLAVNTYWEPLTIRLPKLPLGACWYQAVDTFEEESVARRAVKPEEEIRIRERSVMVFEVGKVNE